MRPKSPKPVTRRKARGYFYIDWNGNIAPCAFFPYYLANVCDHICRSFAATRPEYQSEATPEQWAEWVPVRFLRDLSSAG
jgi:MoaA/NifB/PqqE/SkfB family radical SAM enzyme